jgi:hypothetical protein
MVDAQELVGEPCLDERDVIGQTAGGGIIEEVHGGLLVVDPSRLFLPETRSTMLTTTIYVT